MLVMGCVEVQAAFVQIFGNVADWRLRGWHWQSAIVGDVICAGIIAVEKIEELDERQNLPALADLERTADAQSD